MCIRTSSESPDKQATAYCIIVVIDAPTSHGCAPTYRCMKPHAKQGSHHLSPRCCRSPFPLPSRPRFASLYPPSAPCTQASMIWIIGEYAERIDNADELLESFLETFPEEVGAVFGVRFRFKPCVFALVQHLLQPGSLSSTCRAEQCLNRAQPKCWRGVGSRACLPHPADAHAH